MKFHYEKDGQRLGPVEKTEIQQLIDSNMLTRDSKVWCEEYSDWKKISDTNFNLTQMAPPPLYGDSINNTYLWILAFSPIIGLILQYIIGYSMSNNDFEAEVNVASGKYWQIAYLTNIILCWLDEKQLTKAGHDTSKFKGWLWLVPVYIFKRSKFTKVNLIPFIIWILMFIISLF